METKINYKGHDAYVSELITVEYAISFSEKVDRAIKEMKESGHEVYLISFMPAFFQVLSKKTRRGTYGGSAKVIECGYNY